MGHKLDFHLKYLVLRSHVLTVQFCKKRIAQCQPDSQTAWICHYLAFAMKVMSLSCVKVLLTLHLNGKCSKVDSSQALKSKHWFWSANENLWLIWSCPKGLETWLGTVLGLKKHPCKTAKQLATDTVYTILEHAVQNLIKIGCAVSSKHLQLKYSQKYALKNDIFHQ